MTEGLKCKFICFIVGRYDDKKNFPVQIIKKFILIYHGVGLTLLDEKLSARKVQCKFLRNISYIVLDPVTFAINTIPYRHQHHTVSPSTSFDNLHQDLINITNKLDHFF